MWAISGHGATGDRRGTWLRIGGVKIFCRDSGDLDQQLPAFDDCAGRDQDLYNLAVSRRLETFLRKTDTLCRQGGDEFVLLLPQAPDLDGLMGLAERIQAKLREPYTSEKGSEVLRISVSIGIARWPEHGADTDALLQAADRAMYRCKQSADLQPVMADPLTPRNGS